MKILSDYCTQFKSRYQTYPVVCILLALTLIYAGFEIVYGTTARDNAVPLWILAILLSWRALEIVPNSTAKRDRTRILAWALLALVPITLQLPGGGGLFLDTRCAMVLAGLAVVSYRHQYHRVIRSFPPLVLSLVVIPIQEQLFLAVSYPLRLISTVLTVGSFRLFGSGISSELTTIRLDGIDIAITDACSGISQLAVLILLGYIIVRQKQHTSLAGALMHYCALVPVILFANVVRLTFTIILFYFIGENAFSNAYHATLGYLFVILATLSFYGVGYLFPDKADLGSSKEAT